MDEVHNESVNYTERRGREHHNAATHRILDQEPMADGRLPLKKLCSRSMLLHTTPHAHMHTTSLHSKPNTATHHTSTEHHGHRNKGTHSSDCQLITASGTVPDKPLLCRSRLLNRCTQTQQTLSERPALELWRCSSGSSSLLQSGQAAVSGRQHSRQVIPAKIHAPAALGQHNVRIADDEHRHADHGGGTTHRRLVRLPHSAGRVPLNLLLYRSSTLREPQTHTDKR